MSTDNQIIPTSTSTPFSGLTEEWYFDKKIVLYRLTAISPDIVENWAKHIFTVLETWDKTTPYLAIHDLSQPGISLQYAALVNFDMMNIGITDTGRIEAERLFDAYTRFSARVAVNFNLSLSGQTNRTLMNFLNRDHPSIRYKTFYNRNKSLRWLKGDLKDTAELHALQNSDLNASPTSSTTEDDDAATDQAESSS